MGETTVEPIVDSARLGATDAEVTHMAGPAEDPVEPVFSPLDSAVPAEAPAPATENPFSVLVQTAVNNVVERVLTDGREFGAFSIDRLLVEAFRGKKINSLQWRDFRDALNADPRVVYLGRGIYRLYASALATKPTSSIVSPLPEKEPLADEIYELVEQVLERVAGKEPVDIPDLCKAAKKVNGGKLDPVERDHFLAQLTTHPRLISLKDGRFKIIQSASTPRHQLANQPVVSSERVVYADSLDKMIKIALHGVSAREFKSSDFAHGRRAKRLANMDGYVPDA